MFLLLQKEIFNTNVIFDKSMRKIIIGAMFALAMIASSTAFAQDVNKKCCRKMQQCTSQSFEKKESCCAVTCNEKVECKFNDGKPCCKNCEECKGECPDGCRKEECRKECCGQNKDCKKECAATECRKRDCKK